MNNRRNEWMYEWQGIRRLAEPKDTLSKRYQQFQRRLARHYLNSMDTDPSNDDIATPHTAHTAHSSAMQSINENMNIREGERGRERKALGGLTAAQASTDNRHPHPHPHSLSHSQPLFQPRPLPVSVPLNTFAPAPVRTLHAASTSTSRNGRAVSTSSSVRSTAEDRSSNATFRIFSDNAGKIKTKEK